MLQTVDGEAVMTHSLLTLLSEGKRQFKRKGFLVIL